LQGAEVSQSV